MTARLSTASCRRRRAHCCSCSRSIPTSSLSRELTFLRRPSTSVTQPSAGSSPVVEPSREMSATRSPGAAAVAAAGGSVADCFASAAAVLVSRISRCSDRLSHRRCERWLRSLSVSLRTLSLSLPPPLPSSAAADARERAVASGATIPRCCALAPTRTPPRPAASAMRRPGAARAVLPPAARVAAEGASAVAPLPSWAPSVHKRPRASAPVSVATAAAAAGTFAVPISASGSNSSSTSAIGSRYADVGSDVGSRGGGGVGRVVDV